MEGRFGLVVVKIIVVEALEVGLGHCPPSIVLGLEPLCPQWGVDDVRRVSATTEDLCGDPVYHYML
jgi:hypothetical protein